MSVPTKILVPIDFSGRSKKGLMYAADLARGWSATLVLVSNINNPERALLEEWAESEHIKIDEAANIELRQLAEEVAVGVPVEFSVVYRDAAADGILDAADSSGADLVVMASHGRTGMTRWLLGSVAEKIVRSSKVPVLVVPTRT